MNVQRTVTFAETDLGGLLHFSEYPRLIEEAWAHYAESIRLPEGVFWQQCDFEISYKAPLQYRDALNLSLQAEEIKQGVRINFTIAGPHGPAASGTMRLLPFHAGSGTGVDLDDEIRKMIETEHT